MNSGFSRDVDLFNPKWASSRGVLRAAHPTANALQFYANGDACVTVRCGLDVYYLEYIAIKLNMEIRKEITMILDDCWVNVVQKESGLF